MSPHDDPRSYDRTSSYEREVRVRHLLWRARPYLTCAGIALVLVVVVGLLRPAAPAVRDVWVARTALPAGATLTDGDVVRRSIADSAAPPGVVTDGALTGRRALVDLPAGYPISEAVLSRPDLTGIVPDGRVVAAVTTGGAVVGLLRPGDLVDVYVAQDADASVVAHRAVVLPAGLAAAGGDGAVTASDDGSSKASVLLAVTSAEAARLGALGVWADETLVLVE